MLSLGLFPRLDLHVTFFAHYLHRESLFVASYEQVDVSIVDGKPFNAKFIQDRRKLWIVEQDEPLRRADFASKRRTQ